jgi:pyroglutamyl-peptidase
VFRVLITGFEPFGGDSENSSWAVAEKVAACGIEGVDISLAQMPVSFGRVAVALRGEVEHHRPDHIVMLGQSASADRVKLERVALNMMDSAVGDNDGCCPNEEPINKGGESALLTTLPIKSLRSAIEAKGVRVKISNSAGLYVCNRLYYEALRMCKESPYMQAIFIHLPLYEGHPSAKPNRPTMPLAEMICAVQTLINEVYDKIRTI